MACLGFIGFGNMAKMLIGGFIKYADVSPNDIIVTRNDSSRLAEINEIYQGVQIRQNCAELARDSQYIFICAKPVAVKGILEEIKPYLIDDTHLISLASTLTLDTLGESVCGGISRVIPCVTSEVGCGITLFCHNENVSEEDAIYLEGILAKIGEIKKVNEQDIGFAMELTSCGPGFLASIGGHFTKAAHNHMPAFDEQEIHDMVVKTVHATATLLLKKQLNFDEVVTRVATKGGITQEGVAVFDETLPAVFNEMFDKTLRKLTQE